LTERIIASAIEVHKELEPGLLESTYSRCLAYEFGISGLGYRQEYELPVRYKDAVLDCNYRMDFIVEDKVIIELKTVEKILKVHDIESS